jgi:uncharacterized protein YjbJ (UPF0337 family)
MNNDQLEGNWKEFKGKVQTKWGELTDDEMDKTQGNLDQLSGKIQQKYGNSKEDVQKYFNSVLESFNKKS